MKKICVTFIIFAMLCTRAFAVDLFTLAKNDTADAVQVHLQEQKYSKDELTRALFLAAKDNPLPSVMEVLLKAGADANAHLLQHEIDGTPEPEEYETDRDGFADSPISLVDRNLEKMELLLKYGADPNESFFEGDTLLQKAIQGGNIDEVRLLLRYKANPNRPIDGPACYREFISDTPGMLPCTALEFALGNSKIIELLLEYGALTNKEIYKEALKSKLPQEIVDRLNPQIDNHGEKKNAKTMLNHAMQHMKAGEHEKCNDILADIERSFSLDKKFLASVYYVRSINNDHDLGSAEIALELDPQQSRHHLQYISCLIPKKKYTEALKAIDKAEKLVKRDFRLLLYRSMVLTRLGKFQQAVQCAAQSMAIQEVPQSYYVRGEAYFAAGMLDAAENDFQKAIELGQKINIDGNFLYQSSIHEYKGDREQALLFAAKAKENKKNSGAGWALHSIGKAIPIPSKLIDLVRRDFEIHRGTISDRIKENWKPTNFDLKYNVGKDLHHLEIEATKRSMKECKLPHEKAAFHYLLSYCEEFPKDNLRHIGDALRLNPEEYVYHYRQGELYFEVKQYAEAVSSLKKAVVSRQMNKLFENYLLQMLALEHLGKHDEALNISEKAKKCAKTDHEIQKFSAAIAAIYSGNIDNFDVHWLRSVVDTDQEDESQKSEGHQSSMLDLKQTEVNPASDRKESSQRKPELQQSNLLDLKPAEPLPLQKKQNDTAVILLE